MTQQQGKGQWASNFGFLMAAIGSAVGLGNLWGFPYKMGISGGFKKLNKIGFLLMYENRRKKAETGIEKNPGFCVVLLSSSCI